MKNATDITIILDRSGSMASIHSATVEGINSFIAEQQKIPGECLLSIVQFDDVDPYEHIMRGRPLLEVKPIGAEYQPRGNTPLLDAVGKGIADVGARLAAMSEAERPSKVLFVIVTDGEENASKEYKLAQIKEAIERQQKTYNWQFIFLGANIDAVATAGSYGISAASSMTYAANASGAKASLRSLSANVGSMRGGHSATANFSDADRDEQTKAGVK